jgi:glycosyltransferase involved in cell wall biosynthesis
MSDKHRIGYFVSAYPARSHTFIRREIEELENQGLQVKRYSQRKAPRENLSNDLETSEYEETWSVFPLQFSSLIRSHLISICTHPLRYLETLFWLLSRRPSISMGRIYALIYFVQGIHLANRLRADGIQFLHVHFVNSGVFVGASAARFIQIPWGTSVHGRSDFDYPGIETMRWVIRGGRFLRCISQYGASQAKREVSREYWTKIFTCYSGMPDEMIPRQLPEFRQPRPMKILSVGRLSPEKGQFLLIDLAERLHEDQREFIINIVGDGPDRQSLERETEQRQLTRQINFVGAISETEVTREMLQANVFVCPSLMEGLPQVLLESMAVGLPVVAPYLSGIPELVQPEKTGLLYPVGDPEALAAAVCKLCDRSDEARVMRANAWIYVRNSFALSETIQPLKRRMLSALSKSD